MESSTTLLILGLLVLGGWAAHEFGRRIHVPRVTLLLAVGVLAGPSVLDLFPSEVQSWFPLVTHAALAMVGFLLGEHIGATDSGRAGRSVVGVTLGVSTWTVILVTTGLYFVGQSLTVAILLGGIAAATAPAATLDVIRESRARGPMTTVVLGVVALDDVVSVILFSLCLVAAETTQGGGSAWLALEHGVLELVSSLAVGAALGFPMAWVTGRIKPGEPALPEALGFVLICGGLAEAIGASYLLACMTMGAVVALRASHHTRPFHAIEGVSDPFLAVFFVLAGIELDLAQLSSLGLVGGVYVIGRLSGRIVGAQIGGRLAGAQDPIPKRIGLCLLPQAGVPLGLALLASQRLPDVGATLLPVIVASTVVFELVGPLAARAQFSAAGELRADEPSPADATA